MRHNRPRLATKQSGTHDREERYRVFSAVTTSKDCTRRRCFVLTRSALHRKALARAVGRDSQRQVCSDCGRSNCQIRCKKAAIHLGGRRWRPAPSCGSSQAQAAGRALPQGVTHHSLQSQSASPSEPVQPAVPRRTPRPALSLGLLLCIDLGTAASTCCGSMPQISQPTARSTSVCGCRLRSVPAVSFRYCAEQTLLLS